MSYRKRYIKSKINKIRPKKSVFKKPLFWVIVSFLIVVLFILYFLLFYSGVQVREIIVSGNQKVASEDIINLVLDNINNKFSKSIFLVEPGEMEKKISEKFPEIESVKVNRKFFQTVGVSVIERAPVAIFCPLSRQAGCYFMDDSGIIFESAPEIPKELLIVRSRLSPEGEVEDSRPATVSGSEQASAGKIVAGQRAVQQDIMDLILKVEKSLKDNFQIDLKEALVRSLTRLDVNTSENWKIYFDTSSDIDLQIIKLNLLLSSEISESQRKNLRYINLIPNSKAIICDNPTCGG